ncbi:MAG: hypothetical protein OJF59_001996 [Cytophagales bacterium]|jgi:polyisoprenoid-binding protein YceI|nr:YceI family protein [Bacteroidota bacterium]MBS1980893.1 YceI family protein [Bacteroidota bacterium]WHZ08243.1 MAG: hypothetical protein OJF59_001996 [Cytophagales bacterium]
MRALFLFFVVLIWCSEVCAQKFSAEKGYIKFFSSAAIEDITAENKMASSIFNEQTGEIDFSVPINEFQFEKSLMKQSFNEKYLESEKFPQATFQGKLSGYQKPLTTRQNATATGKMTIHGIAREVVVQGSIENDKGNLVMRAKFKVKLADYNITIPKLLWRNIAEQVEVTVVFNYSSL